MKGEKVTVKDAYKNNDDELFKCKTTESMVGRGSGKVEMMH